MHLDAKNTHIFIALNAKFQPKNFKRSYSHLTLVEYVYARHNLQTFLFSLKSLKVQGIISGISNS